MLLYLCALMADCGSCVFRGYSLHTAGYITDSTHSLKHVITQRYVGDRDTKWSQQELSVCATCVFSNCWQRMLWRQQKQKLKKGSIILQQTKGYKYSACTTADDNSVNRQGQWEVTQTNLNIWRLPPLSLLSVYNMTSYNFQHFSTQCLL